MRGRLDEEEMREIRARKKRSDIGGSHRQYRHEGVRVGQYDLQGRLEREYESLVDAAGRNNVGATYQGIYACCKGAIRKHANRVWRWDKDALTDTLSDLI